MQPVYAATMDCDLEIRRKYRKRQDDLKKKSVEKVKSGLVNLLAAAVSPGAAFVGPALVTDPFNPSDWRGYGTEKFVRDVKPFFEAFYRAPLELGISVKTATYDRLAAVYDERKELAEFRARR